MATYTDPTTIVSTGKPDPVQPATTILLTGGILAVLAGAFFFWQISATNAQAAKVRQAIATKEQQMAALEPTAQELERISNQAKNLHALFDTQKRWPNVLDAVASRLHKNMAVTAIQATDKGALIISGTVPDYLTYAKQFRAFTDAEGKKSFSSVRPTVISKVEQKNGSSYITFTFTLTLQPAVLNAGSFAEVKANAD